MGKGPALILPWIGGLSLLAIGLFVVPIYKDRVARDAPTDWTAHDAKPGTVVDLPKIDLFRNAIRPKARTLVVYAGSCSQCSLNAVPPERLQRSPQDQVVLLYLASEKQLLETFKSPDPRVKLVADPMGTIVASLGAASVPRFYIVDKGALVSAWKDTLTWPTEWTGDKLK